MHFVQPSIILDESLDVFFAHHWGIVALLLIGMALGTIQLVFTLLLQYF
jgi:hypothetical protein